MTVTTIAGAPASTTDTESRGASVPVPFVIVAVSATVGVLLLAESFYLARTNADLGLARAALWLGIGLIVGPACARLCSLRCTRLERVGLLVLAVLALYCLKVLYSPGRMAFPDEFVHFANLQRVAEEGWLFPTNTVLPVSARYPGLVSVATTLSLVSGLGLVASCLLVIGTAHVVLAMALFVLLERLSLDARIASLAVLFYGASPNFLYWSSQFSYQSLSLPLFVAILSFVVCREGLPRGLRRSMTVVCVVLTMAVAVTHHLTGFALAIVLGLMVVASLVTRRPIGDLPLGLALFTAAAAVFWLLAVAGGTQEYLSAIFDRTLSAAQDAVSPQGERRTPFKSTSAAAVPTPLESRLAALASLAIVSGLSLLGVAWTRGAAWRHPLVFLLRVGAVLALLATFLRLAPGAWEAANRSADFLFIGVGLMAAVALVKVLHRVPRRVAPAAAAGLVAVSVVGGSVIGWPATAQLPRALEASTQGETISSQSLTAAEWITTWLPRSASYFADDASGRLLLVRGATKVFTEGHPALPQLFEEPFLPTWQQVILSEERVGFVVLDRRQTARDTLLGSYLPRPGESAASPFPSAVRRKFERVPGAQRIFDSGDIVIYDIRSAVFPGVQIDG